MKTQTEKNKISYDVDKTFSTGKIKKSSIIKIEVWASKTDKNDDNDKLILRTEGDIDSFLEEPLRTGTQFNNGLNRIETMSFWQDEYEY